MDEDEGKEAENDLYQHDNAWRARYIDQSPKTRDFAANLDWMKMKAGRVKMATERLVMPFTSESHFVVVSDFPLHPGPTVLYQLFIDDKTIDLVM